MYSIDRWKKWVDFTKIQISFKSKYWMKLHAIWIELNSNSIEKIYRMQIDGKYWNFVLEYGVREKKKLKPKNWKKYLSMPLNLGI